MLLDDNCDKVNENEKDCYKTSLFSTWYSHSIICSIGHTTHTTLSLNNILNLPAGQMFNIKTVIFSERCTNTQCHLCVVCVMELLVTWKVQTHKSKRSKSNKLNKSFMQFTNACQQTRLKSVFMQQKSVRQVYWKYYFGCLYKTPACWIYESKLKTCTMS